MTIEFIVPGRPVPMARPRVTARGTYTPPRCRAYKEAVALCARSAMRGKEMLEGAVSCGCVFFFEPPKNTPKKRIGEMIGEGYTAKIDTDNLLKAITDAITGIVYEDDKQIIILHGEKRYGIPARAEVLICEE